MPALREAPASGRDAAYRVLAENAARYPDFLPLTIDDRGLDAREAAFANAIAGAALRRWITLAFLLERVGRRPLHPMQPPLQAALIAGAAQLLLLDRVPAHAAIDETVEWTKRRVSGGASKLCNAVLRRFAGLVSDETIDAPSDGLDDLERRDVVPLDDGRLRVLTQPLLPEDPRERVRIASSIPRALFGAWLDRHGSDAAREMALHALVIPPVILNTAHASGALPEGLSAHDDSVSAVVDRPADLPSLLRGRSDLWVQDPTSTAALQVADVEAIGSCSLVVDLCAGRGTKTRQLLAMCPNARVIAADTDEPRLETLKKTLGAESRLTVSTPDAALRSHPGAADLVLLDVPCSNSGVLPRRPEARYRCGEDQTTRLVGLQREILRNGASLLRTGAMLVYATCAIDDAENLDQTEWAASELGLTLVHQRVILPDGRPGGRPTRYRDGGFAALLRRD
ncbi:MAG: hypothetical protein CMJ31_02005 [Phycisphaerae bacterium]|nr:hypothetical protein [Phycisphaerae bacterium]